MLDEAPSKVGPIHLAQTVARGGEDATSALARLVQLAITGGEGYVDPTPLVEGILKARVSARASGQYALADELRDVLTVAGFEIRDELGGSTWALKSSS